ncbi:MAG: T9SS type A sorting domain-containing protein, partial [Lentimicrobiaceae bacterium]|nr:T9SS type A sorting domain-containing protein [Lentimicrobiaceae bacterium]
PLFVDMANHNYRLQLSSPCINTGWLGIGLKEMDLDGYSRVYQARGDMGAYERTLIPDTDGRIYVNQNAPTGDGLGTSWQDAVSELAFPMIAAIYDPSIREIWTAGGTYYPNMYNISPRSTITLPIFPFPSNMVNAASFILPKELAVYGGFAGTETDIEDRDLKSNTTVLSGNLNTIAGGVIHVVLSMNNDNTSTLDGFTIYGGKLDNTSLDYIYDIPNSSIYLRTKNNCGAGIYNYNSNAQYRNLVIADNQTRYQGGGMYNEESSPTLDNVTLLTNKAQQGGGMYNYASSPAVTNSFISNNTAQESGGGIYNEKSSLSLSGVTINGNQAQNLYGGGIYNDWSSSLEFENGIIRSNEALAGGGITNWGDLFLADASIYGNTARNDGGGVYNGGTALLESVQIYDNHADNDGGGCYNYMSSPVLNDVQIYDNHANENGGGFYNINNAYPEFSNVKIFNNAASRGGGFFNRQSNFELTGVAITENTANNHGGGIYMCDWGGLDIVNIPITNNFAGSNGGGVYNLHEPFRLVNVLLTGNHALNAGAVYVQQGDGEMINVTISGNNNAISNFQAITHNNNRLNIYNSIIYGNSGSAGIKPSGFYHSLIENITLSGTPENNLDWWLNPQFVNIQLGDYQLDNNSPCIDAGNNAYIGQRLWGLDLAGNPRWQGASIDMGAYEFASGPSPAPPPPAPPHDSIADNRSPQKPVSNPLAYGDLEIYPNPTTGKLSVVSYQLSEMIGDVEIFDVVGRKLLSLPSPLSPEIEIDISHLANGMYFLKIDGKVKKVIKY